MKQLLLGFSMILFGMISLNVLAAPPVAAATKCDSARFLTFPAWYRGLTEEKGGECSIA